MKRFGKRRRGEGRMVFFPGLWRRFWVRIEMLLGTELRKKRNDWVETERGGGWEVI